MRWLPSPGQGMHTVPAFHLLLCILRVWHAPHAAYVRFSHIRSGVVHSNVLAQVCQGTVALAILQVVCRAGADSAC